MANILLPNDVLRRYTISANNVVGDPAPLPIGRSPTLVNSDPTSLNAVVDTDGVSLLVNALVDTASNISVEVDDGTLKPFILIFDIVEDTAATSVTVDVTKFTDTAQARPSGTPVVTTPPAPAIPPAPATP